MPHLIYPAEHHLPFATSYSAAFHVCDCIDKEKGAVFGSIPLLPELPQAFRKCRRHILTWLPPDTSSAYLSPEYPSGTHSQHPN